MNPIKGLCMALFLLLCMYLYEKEYLSKLNYIGQEVSDQAVLFQLTIKIDRGKFFVSSKYYRSSSIKNQNA